MARISSGNHGAASKATEDLRKFLRPRIGLASQEILWGRNGDIPLVGWFAQSEDLLQDVAVIWRMIAGVRRGGAIEECRSVIVWA